MNIINCKLIILYQEVESGHYFMAQRFYLIQINQIYKTNIFLPGGKFLSIHSEQVYLGLWPSSLYLLARYPIRLNQLIRTIDHSHNHALAVTHLSLKILTIWTSATLIEMVDKRYSCTWFSLLFYHIEKALKLSNVCCPTAFILLNTGIS